MLRLAADSSGDIPDGRKDQYEINILPVNSVFNGVSYQQGIDLDYNVFYYKEAIFADLSISVAAHLGPRAIGIVAYPVEEG